MPHRCFLSPTTIHGSKDGCNSFHWMTLTLNLRSKLQNLEKAQRFTRIFQRTCSFLPAYIHQNINSSLQVYHTLFFTKCSHIHYYIWCKWVNWWLRGTWEHKKKNFFGNSCIRNHMEVLLPTPTESSTALRPREPHGAFLPLTHEKRETWHLCEHSDWQNWTLDLYLDQVGFRFFPTLAEGFI